MTTYPKAKNIKIKFAGQVVTLKDENDRQKTRAGVELWIEQKPAGEFRPMATIPDGTLEKYKHDRPEIISQDWEW
jgi:hypothetical protein